MILSSHILSEVQAVCDEIMIISKGKMVARGTSEELIHQMEKDSLLELEVEGTPQELTELLQQFEKVESFELVEGERPEITKVKIHTSAEKQYPPRSVLCACRCKKMPILSLCRKEDSLEEAFLELTGEAAMKETLEQEKSGKAGSFLHRKKKENDSADFGKKTTDHDREDQESEKNRKTFREVRKMLAIYKKELRSYFSFFCRTVVYWCDVVFIFWYLFHGV